MPQGCCRRVPSRVRRLPPVVGRFDRGGRNSRSSRGVAAICATIAVSRAAALSHATAACATAAVSAAALVPGGSFHPPLRAVAAARSCPIDVQELLPLPRGDEVCLASVWSMCRLPGY